MDNPYLLAKRFKAIIDQNGIARADPKFIIGVPGGENETPLSSILSHRFGSGCSYKRQSWQAPVQQIGKDSDEDVVGQNHRYCYFRFGKEVALFVRSRVFARLLRRHRPCLYPLCAFKEAGENAE